MATIQPVGKTAFPKNSFFQTGKKTRKVGAKMVFPGTGNVGDQYVLAGPLTLDMGVKRILSNAMPALTSVTGANLGFWYLNSAGVLTKVTSTSDVALWSAVNLTAAVAVYQDNLTAKNGSLDNTKNIGQLLNLGPDAEPVGGVFLVLTLPQANTAGGTWDADVEIEEPTAR